MFYDVYANLCIEKGVSESKAAESIGLNRSAVIKWKKGTLPSGQTVQKLADYFGVTTDYLLGNEPKENSVTDGIDEDMLIAFYGDVKGELTEDDKDDLMYAIRAKVERNRRKKAGE